MTAGIFFLTERPDFGPGTWTAILQTYCSRMAQNPKPGTTLERSLSLVPLIGSARSLTELFQAATPLCGAGKFLILTLPSKFGGGTRVVGYAQTFYGTASYAGSYRHKYQSKVKRHLDTRFYWRKAGGVPVGNLAKRVLTACATLNATGNSDVLSAMVKYDWNNVDGGYTYNNVLKGHISAHLEGGTIPLGGYMGMIDGHVEWRPFNQMINRSSSEPYFRLVLLSL